MADLQESVNSEFLEGSFLGTSTPTVRSTAETPGIVISENLTLLAEEQSIEPTTEISSTGSVRFDLTPAQGSLTSPTTSVKPVAMTKKDVVIDGLTIKLTIVQKTVTSQTVLHLKLERATLDEKERNDLYARAMVKHHKLFDLISLAITS
jgi:hypothetical protein